MKELIEQVLRELRGAWRYRWFGLALAWGIGLVGWAAVLLMPNVYESKAKVYVDAETVLKPLLSGLAVNADLTNQVNMMSAVLMSRPNVEKVARDTNLYLRARTAEDFDRLLTNLPRQVTLSGGVNSTYTIAYHDSDPQMAQNVVRRFLNTFVEDTISVKRDDSAGATKFLRVQIKEYEQRLREAEDKLAKFKRDNVGNMPNQAGDYVSRLQAALTAEQDLQARLRVELDKRAEIERQLGGEEPTFGLTPTTPSQGGPNDALIAQYKAQIDQLLVQYTEKHPQVLALRESIAKLEEENRQALASGAKQSMLPSIDPTTQALRKLDINPVYQSMKIALSQTELAIVELKNKLADQQAIVRDLRAKANTIPEIEKELVQLNRDYEVNKAQYTEFLKRLETARLSDEAEQSAEHVKFRVIEPPLVPITPIAPNRVLFLSLVLVFALGAGIAVAVLLNQLKPVFNSRLTLLEETGLPVLSSISSVLSPREERRLRLQPAYLAAGVVMLVVAYGVSVLMANSVSGLARSLFG